MKVRIVGEEFVLAVSRTEDLNDCAVKVYKSADAALQQWSASTRSSPVLALNGSKFCDLNTTGSAFCFIGPIFPAKIPEGIPAFLTLGLFNILLVATSEDEKRRLNLFLEGIGHEIPWEGWHVSKGVITKVTYGLKRQADIGPVDAGPISGLPAELESVTHEYRMLVAATRAKGRATLPNIDQEFATFDIGFRQTLQSSKLSAVTKAQWLVNVNAALSRFSSQTFAGVSPILGTECHYWTHSLLGIGMAAQALLAVRRQVHSAATRANFRGRIYALKDLAPNPVSLQKLAISDGFWQQHYLPSPPANSSDQRLPLIVCFSGRDGFRSTTHTLSVPLEVISAANTVGWTLRTVTHELSHVFIDGLTSSVLPRLDKATELNRVLSLMNGTSQSTNLFEQLQAYFCFALCLVVTNPDDANLVLEDTEALVARVQGSYGEVSEVLTHIFDFLYFYQRDPKTYISAIWGSWDVIPNINDRISEYLTRTLCAILIEHLTVADPFDRAIDQLLQELTELRSTFPQGAYVGIAIDRLKNDRSFFKKRLQSLGHLVRITFAFFYSPEVASQLAHADRGERLEAKAFELGGQIDNPLRFIYDHSGSVTPTNTPDGRRSAWVMAQLAFSEARDDSS
jgi:hypothetical protein